MPGADPVAVVADWMTWGWKSPTGPTRGTFSRTARVSIARWNLKEAKGIALTLAQIAEHLEQEYDVQLTVSALSHAITRGTIRFQRALPIYKLSQFRTWPVPVIGVVEFCVL